VRGLLRLRSVRWFYPRRVSTAAVATVALLCTLLAYAALPTWLRPASLLWALPVAAVGYAVLVAGAHKQWTKRFKHELLDRLGGDVDDATPWLLATVVAAASLVVIALIGRLLG
jgi:hypothetical protein